MDPVCPLYLGGIEKQMEKTVQAEEQKDVQRSSGTQGKGCGHEEAEEKTGLIQAVEPQGVGINAWNKLQYPLQDPRNIGDNAAQQHPLGACPFAE